jgi:type 1 glutamine amidotransferase
MRLLIFTKTTGYRHPSIPEGVAALRELAQRDGMQAEVDDTAECFTRTSLARFGAVIWLSTSGTVLDASQRAAFQSFVAGGGHYVGIHAASAAEGDWPWYTELVGAKFVGHPELQSARLIVEDGQHPATAHLNGEWYRQDEWYEFDRNPRSRARVLISVDESSYRGGGMGDHPLVWCQELGSARSFYTALGHSADDFRDAAFLQHLAGGIRWAVGAEGHRPR